jgi:hypothetical protein
MYTTTNHITPLCACVCRINIHRFSGWLCTKKTNFSGNFQCNHAHALILVTLLWTTNLKTSVHRDWSHYPAVHVRMRGTITLCMLHKKGEVTPTDCIKPSLTGVKMLEWPKICLDPWPSLIDSLVTPISCQPKLSSEKGLDHLTAPQNNSVSIHYDPGHEWISCLSIRSKLFLHYGSLCRAKVFPSGRKLQRIFMEIMQLLCCPESWSLSWSQLGGEGALAEVEPQVIYNGANFTCVALKREGTL